jgi:D-alanyl-D-alanine carboxypeptidase/D-alanyl-D-alanine-endopeptidase (penicillin-binding protein 4)
LFKFTGNYLARFSLALLSGVAVLTTNTTVLAQICDTSLSSEIVARIKKSDLAQTNVGVWITTTKGRVLVAFAPNHAFIPASSLKVFTTAIALDALGANYRIPTRLASAVPPTHNGTLIQGLWVIGQGDPTLKAKVAIPELVRQLKAKGIKRIQGGITFISILRGEPVPVTWSAFDRQQYYGAPVSAFTLDGNALLWDVFPSNLGEAPKIIWSESPEEQGWQVDNKAITSASGTKTNINIELVNQTVKVTGQIAVDDESDQGGLAIPQPQERFERYLKQELIRQGIVVENNFIDNLPIKNRTLKRAIKNIANNRLATDLGLSSEPIPLAMVWSPPLSEIIKVTNQESDNLYAELILRHLGLANRASFPDNYRIAGSQYILGWLNRTGIPINDLNLVDGSGLSTENLLTPQAVGWLLIKMSRSEIFRQSLAIAGQKGTLKSRFVNTAVAGKLQGKTGSLTGVISLVGYLQPVNYEEVVVIFFTNNPKETASSLRHAIDDMVLLTSQLSYCK